MTAQLDENVTTPTLREFLLDLLSNKDYEDIVAWTNEEEEEFQLKNRHLAAKLWGQRKTNATMDSGKLLRAMRYYVGKNILERILH
ncbi:unnamed protein product [Cyprideis torosa]|uniref:Uncharacterized protein n=1 Tax=Cyprideis torosa TaxID=163714 RepID=A0A7R8ZLG2_9CRUS|nr:unnamed protein product [Cyprideis torosa]CAG0883618.1 unnamed protein product [Cyprideis torosa]